MGFNFGFLQVISMHPTTIHSGSLSDGGIGKIRD
jgi:hypothetical protein